MKISIVTTLSVALAAQNCNAFTTSRQPVRSAVGVALNAANSHDDSTVMTRRAAAAAIATLVAAPVAAQAADTSLDFSLPSYDTKMSGFGDGNEAFLKKGDIVKDGVTSDRLMTDPGADEKEKQRAAMQKAEEARKEALAKKKAEQKEREEEAKRRAKEKKARDKERLKNIWGDSDDE